MTDVDFDGLDEQTRRETARIVADDVFTPVPATMTPVVNVPVNPAGITPIEFKVLIDPTQIEDKIGSIILPDDVKTKAEYAQTKGRVVARSPHAFSYVDQAEWDAVGAKKPGPGDIVLYAKYAGVKVKGKDGKDYLIVNDKDVCAVVAE